MNKLELILLILFSYVVVLLVIDASDSTYEMLTNSVFAVTALWLVALAYRISIADYIARHGEEHDN